MFELGESVSAVSNILFGLTGIWMAHSLYRSPRKHWQIVLAWAACYLFLTVVSPPLSALLPQIPYVKLSMLLGFCGILCYIYLFPHIPVGQRIFTYFLVDTSQHLVALLSRTVSTLLAQWFRAPTDAAFLWIYLPLLAGFIVLFHFRLKNYILQSLQAFGTQLTSLAMFAAVGYVTLLLQIDTWGPWAALDVWSAGGRLGMVAFVLVGYMLAFRTLTVILARDASERQAQQVAAQLTMSEQYYERLVAQIEQTRVRDHDLRHHIVVLSGLCTQGEQEKVKEYLSAMLGALPDKLPEQYCRIGAVNALLGHFAVQCRDWDIRFNCNVSLPQDMEIGPLNLCVIFGNALQNAVEACREVKEENERFVEIKAVPVSGQVAIEIVNRCAHPPHSDGAGGYRSTKLQPGHGLGLGSIHATVSRYHGWCETAYENGIFTLRILL